MIYYPQEYHDDKGATIIQHHIVDGLPPEDFPLFLGIGFIQIPTPMGEIEEKISVRIKATDLKEAFAKFKSTMETEGPAEARKIVESIRRKIIEAQKQQSGRIVMANQMPPGPQPTGIIKG